MAAPAAEQPTLAAVIEKIGMGKAQMKLAALAGGIWGADGAELLVISSVAKVVAKEWSLSSYERGLAVSVVFLGILLGNCASGPVSDRHGRRITLIASYLAIGIFTVFSAASQSFIMLCAMRFAVGGAIGFGQPSSCAFLTEVTPAAWRIAMSGVQAATFTAGEVYSALLIYLDDPLMEDLHWRWLLLIGAVPSIVGFGLSFLFLKQSPSFLASRGEYEEAKEVLAHIASDNGAGELQLDFKQVQPVFSSGQLLEPLSIIYSPRLLFTTSTAIFSCFVLNLQLYGCLYAFPQIFTEVKSGSTPAASLLIGALWELPGVAVGVVIGNYMTRKSATLLYLVVSVCCLLALASGVGLQGSTGNALLQSGYFGVKMSLTTGFIVVYQYITEVYPVSARTTGVAAAISGGRVAAIVSPLVFEWFQEQGSPAGFFNCFAVLCLINLLLVSMLSIETAGKELDKDYMDGETKSLTERA